MRGSSLFRFSSRPGASSRPLRPSYPFTSGETSLGTWKSISSNIRLSLAMESSRVTLPDPSIWQLADNYLAKKLGLEYILLPPYGPLMTRMHNGVREYCSLRGDEYVMIEPRSQSSEERAHSPSERMYRLKV